MSEENKPRACGTWKGIVATAVAELLGEIACRKATGMAIVVLTLNQGGVTSAQYSIQEKKKS